MIGKRRHGLEVRAVPVGLTDTLMVAARVEPGGHGQEHRHERLVDDLVEAGRRQHRAEVRECPRAMEVTEDDHASGVGDQVDELGGQRRHREREDLSEGEDDLVASEAEGDAPLAHDREEEPEVDQDAEGTGEDVAERQRRDRPVGGGDEQHHAELQGRRQEVLAEEDRGRLGEDGEDRHEDLVQRVERRQEHQGQQHPGGARVVERLADQGRQSDRHRAQQQGGRHHDRADGHQDRPEHPGVVLLLLVLRHEAAQPAALAEAHHDPAGGGDGERVGEDAVVGLAQRTHDDDLGEDGEEQRDEATDQEQHRTADVPLVEPCGVHAAARFLHLVRHHSPVIGATLQDRDPMVTCGANPRRSPNSGDRRHHRDLANLPRVPT
jgi:hypothetical protein